MIMDWLSEKTEIRLEFILPEPLSVITEATFGSKTEAVTVEAEAIEMLSVCNIPNYITTSGPYHQCVDQARAHPALASFRKKIATYKSLSDASEICDAVSKEFFDLRKEVFSKALDPKHSMSSLIHTVFGTAVDLALPFSSFAFDSFGEIKSALIARKRGWAKFINDTGFSGAKG